MLNAGVVITGQTLKRQSLPPLGPDDDDVTPGELKEVSTPEYDNDK